MVQYRRRATAKEILSIPSAEYEIRPKRKEDAKSEYVSKCLELFEAERKKFPGYRIKMEIKNHVPTFYYEKKDLSSRRLMTRVDRTLTRVEGLLGKRKKRAPILEDEGV